ncbi:SLBB domain-containing protein [Acetohalobium arabaticum]|uniref:Polysaccharide export protein n=1 Tax=Acetohalobium arabaticum (strain ATCC 49924 / DSM 5501 / Z-7288) TaxID=574087 RepID=D9QTC8_ACEAZ|nr:polysaccharide biosynthesis/export family protein [Acetohalobium arabaticum]ADL13628.1 polysaccharide export protein [Acetohalobium arabaticum DSM 5501]
MRKSISVIIGILLFCLLLSTGSVLASDYRLNVDDQLYVSVWGHPDLQQKVVVSPNGTITFPLVGEIQVEGMTVSKLTEVITTRLQEYVKIKPSQVNITLEKYEKFRVMVLGEVKKPGTYQVESGDRILDAISRAGGSTQIADLSRIRLTRGNQSQEVNIEAMLTGDGKLQNYQLQDSDVLHIPQAVIEVTILGEVRQPGVYKLEDNFHLSNLIARAGGLTNAAVDKAEYISGAEVKKIDLNQLMAGDSKENIILEDGDTIRIAQTNWTKTLFYVNGLNAIKSLLGGW